MKPISPSEVAGLKRSIIPDKVIEVFNRLIAKHWNGSSARIEQREIVSEICRAMWPESDPRDDLPEVQTVYNNKWLDVETLYQAAGWKVVYDTPGFNETYNPSFEFSLP